MFWENWTTVCTKIKLDLYPLPCTKKRKIELTWIHELNLKPKKPQFAKRKYI